PIANAFEGFESRRQFQKSLRKLQYSLCVALHNVLHASAPQCDNLADLMIQTVGIPNRFQTLGAAGIKMAQCGKTNAKNGIGADFWIAHGQGTVAVASLVISFDEKPHVLARGLQTAQKQVCKTRVFSR